MFLIIVYTPMWLLNKIFHQKSAGVYLHCYCILRFCFLPFDDLKLQAAFIF